MKKVRDFYFKKAKKEGFPARSVFKLKEAQEKYRFIKKGDRVLELGAAPGSWTRLASTLVGERGRVLAVDLNPFTVDGENITVLQADVYDLEPEQLLKGIPAGGFNVVLSDMAPKTTGNKVVDHLRSADLVDQVLVLCEDLLLAGGNLFVKVFHGQEFDPLLRRCRDLFSKVKVVKPKSSRSESVETFLLCTEFRRKG